MILILMILGASIGAVSYGVMGMALGGALGYLVGATLDMRARVERLEQEMLELHGKRPEASTAHPIVRDDLTAQPGSVSPDVSAQAPARSRSFDASRAPNGAERTAAEISGMRSTSHQSTPTRPAPEQNGPVLEDRGKWSRGASPFKETLERFLTGGNVLVKIGIIILFVGVSFLLKYAAEHSLLPIELRLASAVLGGMALLTIGWRLRVRRQDYALVLQGGGVGVLYLTIFAALRLYSLIPPVLAFAVLVAIGAFSAALAVMQDARSLAVLGISGGFLAPVLASTGQGSHVMLFSYYGLLNAGILGIAWFKAWRILNLVGFTFTFGLGSLWGLQYYGARHFATTEPFLILFFLFYVAVAVLFALRQPPQLKGYVDGTLVFGTPLLGFGLQAGLISPFEHGIALSALALGLFYLGTAWVLFLKTAESMRTLSEAFLAIGVVFGTLAIPLALDNRWTAASWALEGAAMAWIGIRQQRLSARSFGIFLQLLAGEALILGMGRPTGKLPVLNGFFLGCLIIAFAALYTAFHFYRNKDRLRPWEHIAGTVMAAWGLLWWVGGGIAEIGEYVGKDFQTGSIIAFMALSCLACDYLEKRLPWPLLRFPALGLLPGLLIIVINIGNKSGHPFMQAGFVAWPLALAIAYRILYRHEMVEERALRVLHALTFWLLAWILSWEPSWQVSHWARQAVTWSHIWWGLVPSALVLAVSTKGRSLVWPVLKHYGTYITLVVGPVALYTWCWTLRVNFTEQGDPWPLSYLPFLNPLDATVAFAFIALSAWFLQLKNIELQTPSKLPLPIPTAFTRFAPVFCAASLFLWLNAILVRTIHFWGGVGFGWKPMMQSVLFQTSISIFWSLSALFVMVVSTRKHMREPWLTGAGLLGVVVLKLFLVDLSSTGTIARIVSFIGVGALLLVVGYFSPVPPRKGSHTK